jgi:BirA family biotin operon repressor/biotin-[acetyl-CoA-carboxylase] ligase
MQKPKIFIHQFDFEEVVSTMDEANQKVDEGFSDGLVVTARKQTQGRGRNGKSFSSPKDLGLWVTLGIGITKDDSPFQQIKTFSVAMAALLNKDYGIKAKIKWPNDIFCKNKKLCGLLAEMHKNNKTLLLGFGLNVNQSLDDWDDSIKDIATSLFQQTQKKYELPLVLQDVLLAFETAKRQEGQVISELYEKYSLIWGNYAKLNGKKVFIKEIAADGSLVVDNNGVLETVYAGDLLPIL